MQVSTSSISINFCKLSTICWEHSMFCNITFNLKWYNIYKEYLLETLVFHNITKNRYSYKFIRGYIVQIVRQIHFVHSTECHSLIQKNDLIPLDKNFLCIIFYSKHPHLELILALMYIWIGEISIDTFMCIQKRMLTKRLDSLFFPFFIFFNIFVCLHERCCAQW